MKKLLFGLAICASGIMQGAAEKSNSIVINNRTGLTLKAKILSPPHKKNYHIQNCELKPGINTVKITGTFGGIRVEGQEGEYGKYETTERFFVGKYWADRNFRDYEECITSGEFRVVIYKMPGFERRLGASNPNIGKQIYSFGVEENTKEEPKKEGDRKEAAGKSKHHRKKSKD